MRFMYVYHDMGEPCNVFYDNETEDIVLKVFRKDFNSNKDFYETSIYIRDALNEKHERDNKNAS